jgi:hypothetical protein
MIPSLTLHYPNQQRGENMKWYVSEMILEQGL